MPNSQTTPPNLTLLCSTTVFASSGLLLIMEIVTGRILAPYIGVSLYTWTSIIGVILAGLSLGNWLGGIAADRGWQHRGVAWLLTGAAASTLMKPMTPDKLSPAPW